MKSLSEKFGDLLREHRVKAGLTQEALATDCERDRTYISNLERGVQQPTIGTLFKLSAALGTTASAMIKELEKR